MIKQNLNTPKNNLLIINLKGEDVERKVKIGSNLLQSIWICQSVKSRLGEKVYVSGEKNDHGKRKMIGTSKDELKKLRIQIVHRKRKAKKKRVCKNFGLGNLVNYQGRCSLLGYKN